MLIGVVIGYAQKAGSIVLFIGALVSRHFAALRFCVAAAFALVQRSQDSPLDGREIIHLHSVLRQRTLALSAARIMVLCSQVEVSTRWRRQVQEGLMEYLLMLLALQFLCVIASQPSWLQCTALPMIEIRKFTQHESTITSFCRSIRKLSASLGAPLRMSM